MRCIFESDTHKNIMFGDMSVGSMVQANQHIISDNDQWIILDPGGHKIYTSLMAELSSLLPINGLKYIFFSHQDPDIVAATNGWLMVTEADAYLSELWMRFITHFGVDELVVERIKPIPDNGTIITLGKTPLKIIPAHFLHSSGNFQIYDPVAKVLYSGDLGASLGQDYDEVEDFDAHIQYMEGFHKRYIPASKALKMWANTARKLDIDIIAPQHGAFFPNKELVNRFIDWVDELTCGVDLMGNCR